MDVERGVWIELALALGQDPKVVAVQVNRMVNCASVVDDKIRPLVCLRQRDDVLCGIEDVSAIHHLLDRCIWGR